MSSDAEMSDVDADVDAETETEGSDLEDGLLSDSDATVSNVSTVSDAWDGDLDIFLGSDDGSDSNDMHFVETESYSDDEDYDDSGGSSVQVLSEAEQLDVSSVVEVWTAHDEADAANVDLSADDTLDNDVEEDQPQEQVRSSTPPQPDPTAPPAPPALERSVAEEEGMVCTICFEAWTNSGEHRLVSLKCGHLYGQNCIEKWLKGQPAKCPQCNAAAKKADIRHIYAQKLKVLDTTELDRVVTELNVEREKRKRSEVEVVLLNQKYKLLHCDYEKLKAELMDLKEVQKKMRCEAPAWLGEGSSRSQSQRSSPGGFTLDRVLHLGSSTSCRNLATSAILGMLVASQSQSGLFRGYGIRKVSLLDFKSSEFILTHQGEIRDIAFHNSDALVLSASLDKSVKLTSVLTNSIVQTYPQPVEAWSCAWDRENSNRFFAGLRNGTVSVYDLRVTSGPVCSLPGTDRYRPVVAMQHVPKGHPSSEDRSPSGLLVSQFQLCTFFEKRSETEFQSHPLDLEGNCTSVSFEPNTRHVLMTCRPTPETPFVTHKVCNLSFPACPDDSSGSFHVVQSFSGGPTQVQLSRSCLCVDPEDVSNFWVIAGDESYKAVLIWDVASGKRIHQLASDGIVLDLAPLETGGSGWGLAALAKSALSLYTWKAPN
ncbi:E3 ubiquitin-protein ligase RFWD3 [Ixodes scapularis]|uniref:E3 ubiquitin-protein ligase RFWD3 n=1 Tax=Ixodes scapularis TaxID=6945 RepID=UPI0011619C41|nr:E3 ubiquitin-protein ligase RFWD3 [Ixodes scapularis]